MTDAVLLAYYLGAQGPTIRIATTSSSQLRIIRELIGRLGAGLERVEFQDVLPCELDDIDGLVLRWTADTPEKSVELLRQGTNGPSFVWSNSSNGWEQCAALVDALIESSEPGHQYPTWDNVGDDALIELSHAE